MKQNAQLLLHFALLFLLVSDAHKCTHAHVLLLFLWFFFPLSFLPPTCLSLHVLAVLHTPDGRDPKKGPGTHDSAGAASPLKCEQHPDHPEQAEKSKATSKAGHARDACTHKRSRHGSRKGDRNGSAQTAAAPSPARQRSPGATTQAAAGEHQPIYPINSNSNSSSSSQHHHPDH